MLRPINTDKYGSTSRLIVGCMTGTSLDGIDASLVRIEGRGLSMKATVERSITRPLESIGSSLRRIAHQERMSAGNITEIAYEFGRLHLEVVRLLVKSESINLVAVHGQTVFHAPPLSWQLIEPAQIAYGLGAPVVYNMRAADLSLGGQGAPITPLADFILYRHDSERRCIINLGGFCNITLLTSAPGPRDDENTLNLWKHQIVGTDVCACNQLLDGISRELFHESFDKYGRRAAAGTVHETALQELSKMLLAQSVARRSLGTGDELGQWIAKYRNNCAPEDLARTACAAIAAILTKPAPVDRRILAGGGVNHNTLVAEIRNRTNRPVNFSDEYGVPSTYREAAAMAVLGALCQDRVPITLEPVTGVFSPPVSGCWILP